MVVTTLLVALLALAGVILGNPASDLAFDIQGTSDQIHGSLLGEQLVMPSIHYDAARKKRQVDYSDESDLDESIFCILRCTNQFKAASQRIQTRQGSGSIEDDDIDVLKPINLTRFNQMCHNIRPSVQCFDRCPQSMLKIQLKGMLDPIRYMCIDRFEDIKTNARCMQKAGQESTRQCGPRCRRYEDSVNRLKQLSKRQYMRYFYSASDIRDMLSGTCQFIQCQMDCSLPLTRRACGDTAAELTKGIVQKLMASLQGYGQMAGGQDLPMACRRLAQSNTSNSEVTVNVEQENLDDDEE